VKSWYITDCDHLDLQMFGRILQDTAFVKSRRSLKELKNNTQKLPVFQDEIHYVSRNISRRFKAC